MQLPCKLFIWVHVHHAKSDATHVFQCLHPVQLRALRRALMWSLNVLCASACALRLYDHLKMVRENAGHVTAEDISEYETVRELYTISQVHC